MVITMAKLRMAHARTYGARKPPGPKRTKEAINDVFDEDLRRPRVV